MCTLDVFAKANVKCKRSMLRLDFGKDAERVLAEQGGASRVSVETRSCDCRCDCSSNAPMVTNNGGGGQEQRMHSQASSEQFYSIATPGGCR